MGDVTRSKSTSKLRPSNGGLIGHQATMLWYILYPVRGTTEPPVLAPNHPLRKAFSRYGTWAARHVKAVLPISIALIFILLYPCFFLYTTDATNVTNGVSNLPHHVWTNAQPLGEGAGVAEDVIMRSIWIHGSYMKALDRRVLLGALELQDQLLGPTTDFNPRRPRNNVDLSDPQVDLSRDERDTFHIINGLTDQSWFFHSPLQYWGGSAEQIEADQDIISTVNARKTQSTSVNVTLRHSIVFSGKRFEERRLVAADALVITLIHLKDSPVGRQWERKTAKLAAELGDAWQIIPPNGISTSSELYEFKFRPMSGPTWVLLTIAYALVLLYLLLNLTKLRAVKSRLGLMATIVTQITASIGASFTVCAIFRIDLSRIPYYAYPLVVLAISLENSFNLINAVITTSSTIGISGRIGEAFGSIALLAVTNRAANLLLFGGLSWITFPGVTAFCKFAAIAIMVDFILEATFFLSVLSVDVRQRELFELEKVTIKKMKSPTETQPQMWTDTLRQIRMGEGLLSTRVAGTIVVVVFVLIAQAHYAPESGSQWLYWLFTMSWRMADPGPQKSSLLVDIHQARSPTSWLRLQDHETAREVIKVVKPWAHSYVARVHDPVIFVLKGSDRDPQKEPFFLPAVYDFLHNEIPRFVVLTITIFFIFWRFTGYLLQDEFKQNGDPDHPDNEPLLTLQSLDQGHKLDIVMMAVSQTGRLVSVGLDRNIQIWDVPTGSRSLVLSDPENPLEDPFPVWGMAVDDESQWLALVTPEKAMLWNIDDQCWESTVRIDLRRQKAEAVFFNNNRGRYSIPSLVVVRKDGTMVEVQFETEEATEFTICRTPFKLAVAFQDMPRSNNNAPQTAILTVSKKNCIHYARQIGHEWDSQEVKLVGNEERDVHSLATTPYSMYVIGRSCTADLVDLETSTVVHTFQTEPMRRGSMRVICSERSLQSGVPLTLVYVHADTGDLVIQSYQTENEDGVIRNNRPDTVRMMAWSGTKEVKKRIENPGVWEALSSGSIVGVGKGPRVRRSRDPQPASLSTSAQPVEGGRGLSAVNGGLRWRGTNNAAVSPTKNSATENKRWEAWVVNHPGAEDGSFETRPLVDDGNNNGKNTEDQQLVQDDFLFPSSGSNLMVSQLGPIVKLGNASIAVGFGTEVKVVSVGHEHFDRTVGDPTRLTTENLRNLGAVRTRRKAPVHHHYGASTAHITHAARPPGINGRIKPGGGINGGAGVGGTIRMDTGGAASLL